MLPRNFEDKYHSRPHPLFMKCEARAISRDPVLMRAIELRLYARLRRVQLHLGKLDI